MTAVNTMTVPAMNTAAISSVISDQNAARRKAESDYHGIAFNADRNTPADKKALAAAMDVLGKTHVDVMNDQAAIVKARELAATAAGREQAEKDRNAAIAAFDQWYAVERPKLIQQIEDTHRKLQLASDEPQNRLDTALRALHELRRHRIQHAHLKQHHPSDPPGSPVEIRVRGRWLDPSKSINET